jgi:hypothetical protein
MPSPQGQCRSAGNGADRAHGRISTTPGGSGFLRHPVVDADTLDDVAWLQERHQWPGLQGVVMVESERQIPGPSPQTDKFERETRFYSDRQNVNEARLDESHDHERPWVEQDRSENLGDGLRGNHGSLAIHPTPGVRGRKRLGGGNVGGRRTAPVDRPGGAHGEARRQLLIVC